MATTFPTMTLTAEELEIRGRLWAQRLRLQDWLIRFELVRMCEMPSDSKTQVGRCLHHQQHKTALIQVLGGDEELDAVFPRDMDVDLVHELLHLHLAPWDADEEDEPEFIAREQAIELIARALVALERASMPVAGDGGDAGQ